MRLIGFFANMWRGFVGIFIADVASAFPEATYRGQIEKSRQTHDKLLNAAGSIKGELIRQGRILEDIIRELAGTQAKLQAAVKRVAGGDTAMRDVGALLSKKKAGLILRRDEQTPIVESLRTQAERAKRDIRKSEAFIKDLQNRMRTNLARLRSAEQRERLQNMMSGVSIEGDQQAVIELEAAIDQKVGRAELQDELSASSIDGQLEQLEAEAGDLIASDEFDRLVAEQQQQQGITSAEGSTSGGGKEA